MIPVVLEQLEHLRRELAAIDPCHETDAAAQVAAIATALRDAGSAATPPRPVESEPVRRVA